MDAPAGSDLTLGSLARGRRGFVERRLHLQIREEKKAGAGAWHGVRVRWLLESLPGVGTTRADSIMVRLSVPEGRRLGGLTDRQRIELLEVLGR